jgi:hypothetical protein
VPLPRNIGHLAGKSCTPEQDSLRSRLCATALMALSLLLVTLICPICEAASTPAPQQDAANTPTTPSTRSGDRPVKEKAPSGARAPDTQPSGAEEEKPHPLSSLNLNELAGLALVALLFAWLKILTDFHRYKGLLHVLLWNGYSWVFLIFIAACGFVLDFQALSMLSKYFSKDAIWMTHLYLALGHTGASAALAYASPVLLAKVQPVRSGVVPGPVLGEPRASRKRSEMNIVFAAIHESLEGRVNRELNKWTLKYRWEVLKYAANMLTIDQVSAEIIPPEEGERLKLEVNAYKECEGDLENRQLKYELLRKMMSHTSFKDLRMRLAQAEKA